MARTTHTLAAQERKTSDRKTVVGSVGAVAVVAMAFVAAAAPVATVLGAVALTVVVALKRRETVGPPSVFDTGDSQSRTSAHPAAAD